MPPPKGESLDTGSKQAGHHNVHPFADPHAHPHGHPEEVTKGRYQPGATEVAAAWLLCSCSEPNHDDVA